MRFVSWNIQGGHDLDGVRATLEILNPDFIALQEVKDTEKGNSAHTLAQRLGYYSCYREAFETDRHVPAYCLGNAVLSRRIFASSEAIVLSGLDEYEGSSDTEPRNAVVGKVALPGGGVLYVASSHLGYSEDLAPSQIRDRQTGKLLGGVEGRSPLVMGIDANAEPDSPTVRTISSRLVNTNAHIIPTWTNEKNPDQPEYRIDYIFTTREVNQLDFQILPTDASDHRPLVLDFEL